MLKSATSFSLLPDARKAGLEAAGLLKKRLADITLVFAYYSGAYDPKALWAGLAEGLGGIPLMGASSGRGVIIPDGFIGGDSFIALLGLADPRMTAAVGAAAEEDSGENAAGALLAAQRAMAKAGRPGQAPDFFYLAAAPGAEEEHLSRLAETIGRPPFAGATVFGRSPENAFSLITDEGPQGCGLALGFIYSPEPPLTRYASPYRENGHMGLVTRMKGRRRLAEIDGRPALKVMAEYLRCPAALLKGDDLALASALSPLGLRTGFGDLTAVCHPLYGHSDGTVELGRPLYEGLALSGLACSPDDIIMGCGRELAAFNRSLSRRPAGAYHLAINHSWRIAAENRFDELVTGLQAAAGSIPFICPLTGGEHGYKNNSPNLCGNLMMSYTAFLK